MKNLFILNCSLVAFLSTACVSVNHTHQSSTQSSSTINENINVFQNGLPKGNHGAARPASDAGIRQPSAANANGTSKFPTVAKCANEDGKWIACKK